VDKAVSFFAESIALRLVPKGYSNPADFLADVSGILMNVISLYSSATILLMLTLLRLPSKERW